MFEPTEAQLAKLMSLPADAPVAALNLFHFNTKAKYQPGDPEFGTPAGEIPGEAAFQKYASVAGPIIEKLGGRTVFSTPVDQMMIGPADAAWDVVAIMYFPTRQAFIDMLSNPEFQDTSRHRKAALANHRMIHLSGEPFIGG